MKTFLFSTAILACLVVLGGVTHEVYSQQRPANPAAGQASTPPAVVAIDIGKIFKGHNKLRLMQETMKREAEETRNMLQKDKENLQKLAEQLKILKAGTPDYKRLEEDIVKKQAELAGKAKILERQFAEREAQNYFNIYREINDEVKQFADYYKINLVLRYNSDVPDVNDPQSVLRDINKPIVYLTPGLDITDTILAELNKRGPQVPAGGAAGNAAPVGPRRPN